MRRVCGQVRQVHFQRAVRSGRRSHLQCQEGMHTATIVIQRTKATCPCRACIVLKVLIGCDQMLRAGWNVPPCNIPHVVWPPVTGGHLLCWVWPRLTSPPAAGGAGRAGKHGGCGMFDYPANLISICHTPDEGSCLLRMTAVMQPQGLRVLWACRMAWPTQAASSSVATMS